MLTPVLPQRLKLGLQFPESILSLPQPGLSFLTGLGCFFAAMLSLSTGPGLFIKPSLCFPKTPQRRPAYGIIKTQHVPNRRTRRQPYLQPQHLAAP